MTSHNYPQYAWQAGAQGGEDTAGRPPPVPSKTGGNQPYSGM